jgi:hypothetical protein
MELMNMMAKQRNLLLFPKEVAKCNLHQKKIDRKRCPFSNAIDDMLYKFS